MQARVNWHNRVVFECIRYQTVRIVEWVKTLSERTVMLGYTYRYAPHYGVSVNDGPHIGRWSLNITIYYTYLDFHEFVHRDII